MLRQWKIWGAASAFSLMLAVMSSAYADENTVPTKAELQKAFQATIADPGNANLAIEYSQVAERMGDYESAIPPLERLLMFNPDLPDIHLKLGVLYHKLGSDDIAKTHFEEATKSKNVSLRVLSEAKQHLKNL